MVFLRMRRLALAVALLGAQAAGAAEPGSIPHDSKKAPASVTPEPVQLRADRIEGIAGKKSIAVGHAELRKGNTTIRADRLEYNEVTDDVKARGRVSIQHGGDVIRGPSLNYQVDKATGVFERPSFTLAPRSLHGMRPVTGRGKAKRARLEGEGKYQLWDAFFTTCKPGDNDWHLDVRNLDLDYTRNIGVARRATVYFKGVPLLMAPYMDFPLNNQRKSGLLPPSIGTSGKNGAELTVPYYLNLAPNRDLTIAPRFMQKRGLQIGGELRFLEPRYSGTASFEVLPNDRIRERSRSAFSLVMNYSDPGRMVGSLNINHVSDNDYFRDLSTRINIASQTTLPREGSVTYYGGWWNGGWWNATGRIQSFQVLQDATQSIPVPYWRAPQLVLNAGKQDLRGGLDFNFTGEAVDFRHPTQVVGVRTTLYPSLSLPIVRAGGFLTPKIGINTTYYSLGANGNAEPTGAAAAESPAVSGTLTRTLPIFSVDSGLVYERPVTWRGQRLTQTLEPRAYYLLIPYRDQNRIPLFDTAVADFNYAQIFSENSFSGGDRINNANDLTLAVTSRLLSASTGQEVLRATAGQRYYFEEPRVTLDPSVPPPAYRTSDWLGELSGKVGRHWTAETSVDYNGHENRAERLTLGVHYEPEPLKNLSLNYRYLRDQLNQVDVAGQWPLGGAWHGVGRLNYSLMNGRIVEGLAGFEYNGGCWIGRMVVQRFAVTAGSVTQAVFLQLELNGFSRIGSNPLEALRRSIPGYTRLDQATPASR